MDIDAEITENDQQKKSIIVTSLITSLVTVIISMIIFAFWFNNAPMNSIQQNKLSIEEIRKSITISREELELQVRTYIDKNYGELSERDENVDKLIIYFKQQDARLLNIEKALSKF